MRTQLLCTFTNKENLDIITDQIKGIYNVVFNNRSKKIPIIFREPYEATKMIVKMFKNIFGTKIIQSSKTSKIINKKIKCVTQYNLNTEMIYLSEQINNRSEKGRTMYNDIKY